MQNFLVPIDSAIQDFREHLKCHPRTILSARYGDGKSFFIDAFMKDDVVQKEFQFIKLYPVNYQVLENRDIFDVIKYDILLQMGLNDMLDESMDIPSHDAFLYSIKTNGLDLLGGIFDVVGSIEVPVKVKAIGKIGKALAKVINKVSDANKDYKKYKNGDLGVLDGYVEKNDEIPVYEEDLITQIIQKGIASWHSRKENEKKRVVLLLEDMDRIDPAHLFRILNIFSAHMDFNYRYGLEPGSSLVGNKSGVDNVVMVIHYENLESIFHHFYGGRTCFEGYIHKFADKGKFVYSLNTESINYYYSCLSRLSQISEDLIRQIVPDVWMERFTLREMSNSLDKVDEQRKPVEGAKQDLAIVMACLRRLGFPDAEIISFFRSAFEKDFELWMSYLYPYLKYFGRLKCNSMRIFNINGEVKGLSFVEEADGVNVFVSDYFNTRGAVNIDDIHKEVLSLVIK